MKKKTKTKGFKWTGWVKPLNSITPSEVTTYQGNFVMELVINNSLKIDSFNKLKERVYKYLHSHSGRHPSAIRVNRRQYEEYKHLFYGQIFSIQFPEQPEFMGIPLILHEKYKR